jgi:acyl carrier protein
MDKSEVKQRVIKVVCEILNVEPNIVEDDSHFVFDLGAESTQSVQLVAGFEEEFNIEMDNEAALSVETVGGAVGFIEKCVSK